MKRIQLLTSLSAIIILAAACSPAITAPVSSDAMTAMEDQSAPASGDSIQGINVDLVSINIQSFTFSPENITVTVGTQVTWTNLDNVGHTATALDSSFDSGLLNNGESFTFQFDQPGTFEYRCTPHPSMRGIIIVVP